MDDEARERREAELCLIEAAYTPQEAYFTTCGDNDNDDCDGETSSSIRTVVHRKLPLHHCSKAPNNATCTTVLELCISITLPPLYPLSDAPVKIESSINETRIDDEDDNALNNKNLYDHAADTYSARAHAVSKYTVQKLAHNLIPDLLQQLRSEAAELQECEVIFTLFACIQDWMDQTWCDALRTAAADEENQQQNQLTNDNKAIEKARVLGRRLIYSHHLIANSKRKDILQIARERRLGGYSKIGWPGIIIIEGEESDCASFIEDMRSMRWQYLTVRGEQQVDVPEGEDLDSYRAFDGCKFEELGRDDMSVLAQRCRDVGLEDLFRTCMKVYENESVENMDKE